MKVKNLTKDPDYRKLTPQEQVFVQEYLTNGFDPGKAAGAAYKSLQVGRAREYGKEVLQRERVAVVLHKCELGGKITPLEFWAQLMKVARQDESHAAKMGALRLIAEMMGWTKGKLDEGSEADDPLSNELEQLAEVSYGKTRQEETQPGHAEDDVNPPLPTGQSQDGEGDGGVQARDS